MPTPGTSFLTGIDDGVAGSKIAYWSDLGVVENRPEIEESVWLWLAYSRGRPPRWPRSIPGSAYRVDAFTRSVVGRGAEVPSAYTVDDRVDPGLRRVAEIGLSDTASDFLDATAERMELGRLTGRSHQQCHVLIMPTLPITAFPVGQDVPDWLASPDWTSWTPDTHPFNLTQQPALTSPAGLRRMVCRLDRILSARGTRTLAPCASVRCYQRLPIGIRGTPTLEHDEQVHHRQPGQARREPRCEVARRCRASDLRGGVGRAAVVGAGIPREVRGTSTTCCCLPSCRLIRGRRHYGDADPGDLCWFSFDSDDPGNPAYGYENTTGIGTRGAIVDLAVFYGRNNLLINGDQGWVPGNVFGAIVDNLDAMAAACQDLWMGGAAAKPSPSADATYPQIAGTELRSSRPKPGAPAVASQRPLRKPSRQEG